MKYVLFFLLLIPDKVLAKDFYLLEPTNVYVDLYKYQSYRDPYLAPVDKDISQGASFHVYTNLIRWRSYKLHWNNDLYFDQSRVTQQIVHAGYHYELGMNIINDARGLPRVELFKEHNSEHIMDTARPAMHFPVYDRYGIRLRIFP
jgi:hypothetical protein